MEVETGHLVGDVDETIDNMERVRQSGNASNKGVGAVATGHNGAHAPPILSIVGLTNLAKIVY